MRELVRADPELLYPIRQRGVEVRYDLVLLRARDALVAVRTKLINCVRGQVKSVGGRLPKCSVESFHTTAEERLPNQQAVYCLGPCAGEIVKLMPSLQGP
jgi:hypothetical protein